MFSNETKPQQANLVLPIRVIMKLPCSKQLFPFKWFMVALSAQVTYQLRVPSVQIKRHNEAYYETRSNRDNHSKNNRAVLKQHIKLWEYTLEVDRTGWNIQVGTQSPKDRTLKHNILVSGYLRYLRIVNIHCDSIVTGSVFSKHIHKRQPIYILWGTSHGQGAVSIRKTVLQGMVIPMLKIRRPNGRLIFNMEIAICR